MSAATILVIEDDPAIRRGLVDTLGAGGYHTMEAADGDTGMKLALSADYALILLDIKLPGPDGFAILEQLRKSRPGAPVIMTTALGDESSRVRGLKGGADDYIIKGNFSALELLARVEAVLRRSAERSDVTGSVELDGCDGRSRGASRRVRRRRTATDLSQKESELIQYLAGSRGRVPSAAPSCFSTSGGPSTRGASRPAPSTCTSRACGRSSATRS